MSTGRIGQSDAGPRQRPTWRGPRPIRPAAGRPATSGSGTTSRAARERSHSAEAVGCTTSGSARRTHAAACSRSSMSRRSPSSPSIPASCSRPTGSSLAGGTGATNDETRADGRGLRRRLTASAADVATHPTGAPGGIRTPDLLIRPPKGSHILRVIAVVAKEKKKKHPMGFRPIASEES